MWTGNIVSTSISHAAPQLWHIKSFCTLQASPSAAFSSTGRTVVEYITETKVSEDELSTAVIKETTTVNDLASALNELSLRPRDVIAIFQAIKQAGALNAKLIGDAIDHHRCDKRGDYELF